MAIGKDMYGNYQAYLPNGSYPTPGVPAILLVAGNPTSLGTVALPNSFAFNTVGDTMYWTANGTTWTQVFNGGTGGGTQVYNGTGSPVGAVNATTAPAIYFDTTNPAQPNAWYTTTTGTAGWVEWIGN
jgi:hypothetical protein